jgi:hypothetical protein
MLDISSRQEVLALVPFWNFSIRTRLTEDGLTRKNILLILEYENSCVPSFTIFLLRNGHYAHDPRRLSDLTNSQTISRSDSGL